jgi:hypothetical protein
VESRPRDNDPLLTGTINATDRTILKGGHSIQVIQLLVDQADLVARFHACRCRSLVERFAGSLDESLDALQSAHELGIAAGLGEEITDVDIVIGKILRHKGDADAAVRALRAVVEGATRVRATRPQRQAALFDLGLSLLYRRDVQSALAVANELDALVRPGDPVQVRAGAR